MKKLFHYIFVCLLCLVPLMIFGRNNLFLGTAYNLTKWFFLITSSIYIYLLLKKNKSKAKLITFGLISFSTPVEMFVNFLEKERIDNVDTATNEIKILSQNLYFKNRSKTRLVNQIKKENPDILAVQEMTYAWQSMLDKHFGKKYPYKKRFPQNGTHGKAVYSKFPITSYSMLKNKYGRPYVQILGINVKGKKIQFFNTHLLSPAVAVETPEQFVPFYYKNYLERVAQFESILTKIDKNTTAQIMAGDFNTMYVEPLYRVITKNWINTAEYCGISYTSFPNHHPKVPPIIAIDYILVKGQAEPTEFKSLQSKSSDHLGVIGKIKI